MMHSWAASVHASEFMVQDADTLGPCQTDLVMFLDGGRQIESKIVPNLVRADGTAWPSRSKQTFTIVYDEDTWAQRRERTRGFVQLTEGCHVYTAEPLQLDKRARLHFPGSNMGDTISGVPLPPWKDQWLVDRATKLKLYTPNGRHLSGGPNPEPDFPQPKFDREREPVSWHSCHLKLYEEILVSFHVKAVVDLSTADETFALACIQNQIPYLGVCWGDTHTQLLSQRLSEKMWELYKTAGSPLYRADM